MFKWDSRFDVGNSTIDNQHRKLFELLNELAEDIQENTKSDSDLNSNFNFLLEYAKKHFKDEEQAMNHFNIDSRHVEMQHREHASFMYELDRLGNRSIHMSASDRLEKMVSFVTSWLVFHTLSTDQYLGIQLNAIKDGMSPKDAYIKSKNAKLKPIFYRYAINALVHMWAEATDQIHKLESELGFLSQIRNEDFDKFYSEEMPLAHDPNIQETQ